MHYSDEQFDVIVIGAGHAGVEAALATARLGVKTCIVTMNLDTIARMPCNPAIGGIGKGHLVKEIDALGGEMAKAIDATGIQFRRLNTRKGAAVQASRAQADRLAYHKYMRSAMENCPNLHIRQGQVTDIITENKKVIGVKCFPGITYEGKIVINTAGTFLNGLIHIGMKNFPAGRDGEFAAQKLSESYHHIGFNVKRLKTGTPPRLDGNTIDFSKMVVQHGDYPIEPFSFETKSIEREQIVCYLGHTTPLTIKIIRSSFDRSPLFTGIIEGIGPRYCPSIETKVDRFPDRVSHHIFMEPEGLETTEYYANGISTSLPYDTQVAMVHSIPGLENAEITRPGYAIEYDFFPPDQLKLSLETKKIENLFHAGQINGTSGYEEAAAQGIIAGINAVLKLRKHAPLLLRRDEAYTGVMIDDLCNQGVLEPYRMFTSRAEYRLLLREDNADKRLTQYGFNVGLVNKERYQHFKEKYERINNEKNRICKYVITPSELLNKKLEEMGTSSLTEPVPLKKLVTRPEVNFLHIRQTILTDWQNMTNQELKSAEYDLKYEGYIKRQEEAILKYRKMEEMKIPINIDYSSVHGLNSEMIERLTQIAPKTLGQASRVPGVTPAAISVLMIAIKSNKWKTIL